MSKSLLIILILTSWVSCKNPEETFELSENKIWYDKPAAIWNHALPIGNGRFGAMVFGDPVHERIQLNEDSMWPGAADWGDNRGTPEDLKNIRNLISEGRVHEADKQIVESFSRKDVVRSHQTMGDLLIDFEDEPITKYSRTLSLDSALVTVNYVKKGAQIIERVFSSYPDDVLVISFSTDAIEGMNFNLRLTRPEDHENPTVTVSNPADNQISMKGTVTQYGAKIDSQPAPLNYGVNFESRLEVIHSNGSVVAANGQLSLEGVASAVIYVVSASSFYEQDYIKKNDATLASLENHQFATLLSRHVQDHQSLFKRVNLDLGGHLLDSVPTDVRLANVRQGASDPDLVAKMFQYGRYLLIASSRPGTNPANLQGIWNEHIEAPWNADYHFNINLQMNYWPAEVANLSESHEPLFDYIDRLIERGRIVAAAQYGCRGAVVHHASDLWAPAWMRARQPYWGSWVHGGGWLVQHFWEHYHFTGDKQFLKERAYPAMQAIAEFYLDCLVKHPEDGLLVASPSTSPENSYIAPDGQPAAVTNGTAMGQQIVTEVFNNVLAAANILQISDEFTEEVQEKSAQLRPGMVIGPDGRILEWDNPYEEAEKGHRHMSHLYALYPGKAISSTSTPDLFEAARKTLDYRLENGGAGTGWSRAWLINFSARLLDGEMAEEHVSLFLKKSTELNLFDMHPPFQIDGNFGFTAGIAEMLIQSHTGNIHILPALPDLWATGKVAGLKGRGGFEVDIEWEEGNLTSLRIKSLLGRKAKVRYREKIMEINIPQGETWQFDGALDPVE